MAALIVPLVTLAVGVAPPASAASTASSVDPTNGFPFWYEDAAGTRVDPCLDTADANCALLPGPTFDPALPIVFPTNFPDEFFYAFADSEVLDTPGCGAIPAGRVGIRLDLEGAFLNGDPVPGDQMTFGRIRVRASGLCADTAYQFVHPFGTETFTTDEAGDVKPAAGTEDIGCVPTLAVPCDFSLATGSRVVGAPDTGFLRWDPTVAPAAPAGYLGDGGATLHPVVGGTNGNRFTVLNADGTDTGLSTDLFAVGGRLAGSLLSSPNPVDFVRADLDSTSAPATVTVTNVDATAVTVGSAVLEGADPADFTLLASAGAAGECADGTVLARDESCTYQVTFNPTGAVGRRSAQLVVPSTGGVRSPLRVALDGTATLANNAPILSIDPTSVDFGNTRVRESSAVRHVQVTNLGDAPLHVTDVRFDPTTAPEYDHFRIRNENCTTGLALQPAASCTIDVQFAPITPGGHATAVLVDSNASPGSIALTGNGTGGNAAVSTAIDPVTGFPEWYRDDAGVKVGECIDPDDPNCIVLADPFYDPAQPLVFPTNFPSEYFYFVADSDNLDVDDPNCAGATGRGFMRAALEAAFAVEGPVDGDQMVFGRIRYSVTDGLCPGVEYVMTSPYGADVVTADADGALRRSPNTDDVGCVPTAPFSCDFSEALASRVLGGLLRWDPTIAPAAPAGYLGDAATLHRVVGAPYSPDGLTPANYFSISRLDTGEEIARTDLFTVMGKLRGPLEADVPEVDFGTVEVGATSDPTPVTLSNTGLDPITISSLAIDGGQAAEFAVDAGTCASATLAPGDQCQASLTFSPSATGARGSALRVRHDGLNDPFDLPITGIGGAPGGTAAISFAPTALDFGSLHTGRASEVETITVSNAGGTADLTVFQATPTGANAADVTVVDNRCGLPVAPGDACEIDVVFTPGAAGDATATITLDDNAPGSPHAIPVTGRGSDAVAAVSPHLDAGNGFPTWYQDENGVRLAPCLDSSGNCIVLADQFFDPAQPVRFPDNFPGEFFYAIADSDLVTTPGCAGGPQGTAFLRVALEGSFGGGAPLPGDQIVFGRIRVRADGLCPGTPYTFVTPYGPVEFTADAVGEVKGNGGNGTIDVPDALTSAIVQSFPRWNPNTGAAAPVGYLGDGATLHRITGGSYTAPGDNGALNAFEVREADGTLLGRTARFIVAGKLPGPLEASGASVDFGSVTVPLETAQRTVTVTNVAASPATIDTVALTGTDVGDFTVTGGSCATGVALATDESCTVEITFAPLLAGAKSARLDVSEQGGQSIGVALTGTATELLAPAIGLSTTALSYGAQTVGTSTLLPLTVSNTGTGTLNVTDVALSGSGADQFRINSNTCTSVAPGASCSVQVAFEPTTGSAATASLDLTHNAVGSPSSVALTGSGQASTFSVASTSFGKIRVGQSKSGTVKVRNTGTIGFRVTAIAVTGAQATAFTVTGGNCLNATLAAGRTCSINVTFRPTAAIAYSAGLAVTGDATSVPRTVTGTLSGSGR